MDPDAALIACRILHDASAMLLWGAFAYLAACVPRDLASATGRRLTVFRLAAIAVAVATTAATLPLASGAIGEGWGDAIDPATIRSVLFETSVGSAWLAQGVAALVLAATLIMPAGVRQGATALASGLLLACLGLKGHAVMHRGWLGVAHGLNHIVHVLAAGAWLGALVPLLPILDELRRPGRRHQAAVALRRFSTAGHIAVALVIATGTVNTGFVLGRWPFDWSSAYQALLAAKIGLVAAMALIALVNRYVLVTRMRAAPDPAIRMLIGTTAVELAIGAGVLGLVGVFGTLEPA